MSASIFGPSGRRGLAAAVICPIGFVCDHVEVLYDLDIEAAQVCRDVGLPMARAATVNDDPLFLEMMADEVVKTWDRYRTGRPLVLSANPNLNAASIRLNKIAVSDRDTLRGLTQFPRTADLIRVKPLNANENEKRLGSRRRVR